MHTLRLPLAILAATLVAGCGDTPLAPDSSSVAPSASPAGGAAALSSSGESKFRLTSTLRNPAQGETNAIGTATLRCRDQDEDEAEDQDEEQGTRIDVKLSGLLPHGVYTLWLITTGAKGAAGASDGSQNVVRASRSGHAKFRIFVRPSDTGSFTPGVHWPACVDGSNLIKLVVDGHTDGLGHGGVPGPNNYDLMTLP
jgi:hypothetical protein